MNSDIEFGEVQQYQPAVHRRPDTNHQYAVCPVHAPLPDDLPIFVDLDVMCELEDHALDDPSVELGGVLIGGQYRDEAGRPFVVITDSLRAKHYESTEGSFKFTHQTWTALTRELQAYSPEQRIVGWYHTHPNWGVFLSGMDLFICDHFFNQSLDVALVIDPCRQDRGFFQWTGQSSPRIRRTGGFYLMTSRLRANELEEVADMYENMTGSERTERPERADRWRNRQAAPVVHLHGFQPNWSKTTLVAILILQVALLMVLASSLFYRMESSGPGSIDSNSEAAQTLAKAKTLESQAHSQLAVVDRIIANWESKSPRVATELAQGELRQPELHADLRAERELVRSLDLRITGLQQQLQRTQQREQRVMNDLAELQGKFQAFRTRQGQLESGTEGGTVFGFWDPTPVTIAVWTAPVLLIVGGLRLLLYFRKRTLPTPANPDSKSEPS